MPESSSAGSPPPSPSSPPGLASVSSTSGKALFAVAVAVHSKDASSPEDKQREAADAIVAGLDDNGGAARS